MPKIRFALVPQTGQSPCAMRRPESVTLISPVNERFSLHLTQNASPEYCSAIVPPFFSPPTLTFTFTRPNSSGKHESFRGANNYTLLPRSVRIWVFHAETRVFLSELTQFESFSGDNCQKIQMLRIFSCIYLPLTFKNLSSVLQSVIKSGQKTFSAGTFSCGEPG